MFSKMSDGTKVVLGVAVFLVLVVSGIFLVYTPAHEVTLKVTQPFSAAAGFSDQPRVQVEIMSGDQKYEAGDRLQLEYRWVTCKDCDGNVWADGGNAMAETNAAVSRAFQQDHCYKLSDIRPSSEPYVLGNPVVLFESDKETSVEIPCP